MRINSKEELLNKKAQIEQKLKDFTMPCSRLFRYRMYGFRCTEDL